MRSFLASLPFAAVTFFCWGIYGPVLHHGVANMGASKLRPFICVGMAYFVIAVIIPIVLLQTRGEKGHWTKSGTIWSLIAGACGAVGALGIIMALSAGGSPIYVMPLVFGCAPVVNTFVSMWMTKSFKDAGMIFYIGIVMVAMGGAGVMFFKPSKPHTPPAASADSLEKDAAHDSAHAETPAAKPATAGLSFTGFLSVIASVALTALCWGSYGSVLHKGQHLLGDSRLRALLCVGISYFLIAVIVPFALLGIGWESGAPAAESHAAIHAPLRLPSLQIESSDSVDPDTKMTEPADAPVAADQAEAAPKKPSPHWSFTGSFWALLAGAAGAGGALGMIFAFNFGGKPIYVMPIVFGCAPVVNTFVQMFEQNLFGHMSPMFYASLILVIAGAATVLVFSPKPKPKAKGDSAPPKEEAKKEPEEEKEPAESTHDA